MSTSMRIRGLWLVALMLCTTTPVIAQQPVSAAGQCGSSAQLPVFRLRDRGRRARAEPAGPRHRDDARPRQPDRRRVAGQPDHRRGHRPPAADPPGEAGLQQLRSHGEAGRAERAGADAHVPAFQASQQSTTAPAITPAMAANLKLYKQYTGQINGLADGDRRPGPRWSIPISSASRARTPTIVQISERPRRAAAGEREPREGSGCAAARKREHREGPRYHEAAGERQHCEGPRHQEARATSTWRPMSTCRRRATSPPTIPT